MNDLISVIVPVYNVEQYLERCLTSIINQTYFDIEIILVDDGSTDTSGSICEQYAEKDIRVKVIHQDNAGPSEARNRALHLATGKYIAFVDADDYVANDYIQYLYDLLNKANANISCCNTQNFPKGTKVGVKKKTRSVYVMDTEEALCQMLYEKKFSNSVWGKLYKTEVFNEIEFPKGKIFEDMFTTYKLILNSKCVVYGNSIKYYYMKHEKSIMSTTKSHDRMQVIDAESELIDYISEKYPKILKAAYSKLFASSIVCLAHFDLDTKCQLFMQDINILWRNIKKFRLLILCDGRAQIKYKILACISFIGKRGLCLFYHWFIK